MNARVNRLFNIPHITPCDAILISAQEDMRYFCGFTGEGSLLLLRNTAVLFTDSRYIEQAYLETKQMNIVKIDSQEQRNKLIAEYAKGEKIHRLGIQDEIVSLSDFHDISTKYSDVEFIMMSNACLEIRAIKEKEEIEFISKAAKLTDEAFSDIIKWIKPGLSEREMEIELTYRLNKAGSDGLAFSCIVASGENSAMPHATPSQRVLKNGDVITLDFGAKYQGYCADMTRTFALSYWPEDMLKIYQIVLTAQQKAIDSLKANMHAKAVDQVARSYINENEYGQYFGHGLGHGVGLCVHEKPRLSPQSEDILLSGMVVTIEPGIYIPKKGGVRIEDLCVVTNNGCNVLTTSTKKPIVL